MKKITLLLVAFTSALIGCGERYDHKALGFESVEEMKLAHAAGYHNKTKYLEMTQPRQATTIQNQQPISTANIAAKSSSESSENESDSEGSEESGHSGSIESDDGYLNDPSFGLNIQAVKKALDSAKSGSKEDVEQHLVAIKTTKESDLLKPRNRKKARQLNEEALAKLRAGDVEQSVDIFLKAHEEDPLDSEIAANISATALQIKDYRLAELFSYHTFAINPRKTTAWFPYSLAKYQMGQRREAYLAGRIAWLYSSNQDKTLAYLYSKLAESESEPEIRKFYDSLINWFKNGIMPKELS